MTNMMRQLILISSLLFFTLHANAQKKQISEARSLIKSKSKLEQAESSMRTLLKDSANRDNIKIYVTLAEAVRARYEAANEQLYLKLGTDTAALFKTARTMFLAYESLDSVDMRPDDKGRIRPAYRKKNAADLDAYRPNLFNGGLFFVGKQNYADAYDMFDAYLQCASQPLFTAQRYSLTDSTAQAAAFWSVFCGFKQNSPAKALAYKDTALASGEYRRRTLVFLAETYQLMNDTAMYVKTLGTGFEENPSSPFFFTRIMDYYGDKGRFDTALDIADKAVRNDPKNPLFLFGKSNALLNLGRYEECLVVCDTLINRKNPMPDVYYNAGASYINMAVLLEEDAATARSKKNRITAYYKMALPYMEKFRQNAPEQQSRWAPALYNIYLKLNMGQQFEEISNLLRKAE